MTLTNLSGGRGSSYLGDHKGRPPSALAAEDDDDLPHSKQPPPSASVSSSTKKKKKKKNPVTANLSGTRYDLGRYIRHSYNNMIKWSYGLSYLNNLILDHGKGSMIWYGSVVCHIQGSYSLLW